MLFEIFKFEIKYRARRPDTYLYFTILFLFATVVSGDFLAEGNLDPLKINAPYVIARTMGTISALFMMIISMIMGVAVLRDFDHQMESLMFINPIKKRDYLLGRFLGSFAVLVFIFSGLLLGMMLSNFMPWMDIDALLPFNFWHYLQPFLFLVMPTLFFGGAIFFVSGTLSRKLIVVYTQGVLFLIVYLLAMNLARNAEDRFLAALLEPFTFQSIGIVAQFWTVLERNSLTIPMDGVLLYNRLIWLTTGMISLVIGYYSFNFIVVKDKGSKKKLAATADNDLQSTQDISSIRIPVFGLQKGIKASLVQLKQHAVFSFFSIVKEVSFWAIVICGMAIIFINSINLDTTYGGVNSYPTTYIVVGELVENSILFFLLVIVFYSGEVIWKERDIKMSLVYDALPTTDFISLAGKFIGFVFSFVVLMLAVILAGIVFQTSMGYYQYELGVYFAGFFLEIFPFLFFLAIACFFFQVLINHKFIAHIAVVILVFAGTILLNALGYGHGLISYGGIDLGSYSDMNGYGHFLEPYFWFKVYWIAISILLFIVAVVLSVRGTETQIKKRWKTGRLRLTKPLVRLGLGAVFVFITSGSYIFYNTNILNEYTSSASQLAYRADYEKTLKPYQYFPQPKIVDVNLTMDLYPYERDYTVEGYFILANQEDMAIDKIHIQKRPNKQVSISYLNLEGGAEIITQYEQFGYQILALNNPLQPGDSIKMMFKQTYNTVGFTHSKNTDVVYNGTFLNNFHFPTIGYNEDLELKNKNDREQFGLPPKIRNAKIDNPLAIKEALSDGDGEAINFEMVISTDSTQIAIAPGYLQKEWTRGNRKYFHYKMDTPMSNFYSIISATYEVMQDQWIPDNKHQQQVSNSIGPVNLEIYYHKGHEYNLDRMMKGMKKSFDYLTKYFTPYQYRQMRILEFPRYKSFAQSFPNTIPFSESIGFIMDIKDDDIDFAFYVTAHEIAHQWWGHQVNPAGVQGNTMITEALAQYSAAMIMKHEYPEEQVQKLLNAMMNRYLVGRAAEKAQEMPLSLVESGQEYIHYGKGMVNFYALQDYISEDSLNIALKRFIKDWDSFEGQLKTQTNRYSTTNDLLPYLRNVTPDSLQYVINDLFETITLYKNETKEATFEEITENQYKVNLIFDAVKYRIDSLGYETSIGINDWIDIGIYAEGLDGNDELIYLEKHKITDQEMELEVLVNQKPVKAGIDPLNILIDREMDDNLKSLTKKE